jgi:nitroreductase
LPEETLECILQAGRWTGSAKNIQPWEFLVVQERQTLKELAACGHFASHLIGAAAAIAIVTEPNWANSLDVGRVAQNMMLVAWGLGVGSCIATLHDEGCARAVLTIPEGRTVRTAISFGYPLEGAPKTIEGRPREEILASTGRKPLEEMVHWGKYGNRYYKPGHDAGFS